jgi:hypothetical protein
MESHSSPLKLGGSEATTTIALANGRAAFVRPFFNGAMIMDGNEQTTVQGDKAAKVIASIIIVGIVAMFGYGLFGWIVFG